MASGNKNAARIRHDRILEVTLSLWDCHGQREKVTATILLPESGDHKGRLPNITYKLLDKRVQVSPEVMRMLG